MPAPYRITPVFDELSLPVALRNSHRTKPGVWGIIRILEGQVKLTTFEPDGETILDASKPGLVLPEQPHFVEPLGPMKMQVEFFEEAPDG